MVAGLRAIESERGDALFRDPLASKLCTCLAYSRMRYDPGVQTGILSSAFAGIAAHLRSISTSIRCELGIDIETL